MNILLQKCLPSYMFYLIFIISFWRCSSFPTLLPYCCIYALVNWVSIGSGNGFSHLQRQAITWTNTDVLSVWTLMDLTVCYPRKAVKLNHSLTGPSETNFSGILIEIQNIWFHKCIWKCRLQNGGHFVQGLMSWPCVGSRIFHAN